MCDGKFTELTTQNQQPSKFRYKQDDQDFLFVQVKSKRNLVEEWQVECWRKLLIDYYFKKTLNFSLHQKLFFWQVCILFKLGHYEIKIQLCRGSQIYF